MMSATKIALRLIAAHVAALALQGCDQKPTEKKPREGTSAYYAKYLADHGVVKGKDASLKVGGHMFILPANVLDELTLDGSIVQDQPDVISFWLRGSAARPTGAASIPESTTLTSWVRIQIRRSPGVRDGSDEGFEQERPWGSIREIPEWELKEYRATDNHQGWANFNYEGIAGAPKTLMGNPVRFSCTGDYTTQESCWSSYRFNPKIQIWYFFPAQWIPIWQQVHQHVVQTVDRYHKPTQP
jgi:hypothetical protein